MKAVVATGITLVSCVWYTKLVTDNFKKCMRDLEDTLDKVHTARMKLLTEYRVERHQQVQEMCSVIDQKLGEWEEWKKSLETIKKTAFLEGQMAAKRGR